MSNLSIAPIIMTTITTVAGVYWLFIYFRKRTNPEELSFSLTCFAIGVYGVHCVGLYNAANVVEGVAYQQGQTAATAWIAISFTFFVSHYTRMVPKWFLITSTSFFSAMLLTINFANPNLTWNVESPFIKSFEFFGHSITYYESDVGPLGALQIAALVVSFIYLLWVTLQQFLNGDKKRATPLLIAMPIFFASVTNDMLISAGLYQSLYLGEYGYISIVLLMAHSLSNEIVESIIVKGREKQLEEQLAQAQKLEAIGRLAGGVAHDLNNQLTPIVGYAEIALSRERTTKELKRFMGLIKESAEHAKELSWQLLAFGRKQVLELKPLNLNRVMRDYEKMIRRVLPEDIELLFKFDNSLENTRADIVQLRQILMNLVLNARDAMPEGGLLSIETYNVETDRQSIGLPDDLEAGQYVCFTMNDTGKGMDKQTCERIFEPFFTTKNNPDRTGWGLSTVYGIVKQHSGSISVFSELNKGTTFRVYLPQTEETSTRISQIISNPKELEGIETILLVEDEDKVRKMVKEVLATYGYTIIQSADPLAAIELADRYKGPIQLLLTDVIMPNMNGKELYNNLQSKRSGLGVLYMSGYSGDIIARRGILEDGVDFISKPFSVHKLLASVRGALDRKSRKTT